MSEHTTTDAAGEAQITKRDLRRELVKTSIDNNCTSVMMLVTLAFGAVVAGFSAAALFLYAGGATQLLYVRAQKSSTSRSYRVFEQIGVEPESPLDELEADA